MPFISLLEQTPEYVSAIGMISIENANMEASIADLFSAIIGLSSRRTSDLSDTKVSDRTH